MKKGKKTMALLLSCIPGTGHMYIGLQKQGLQYMSIFFFIIFFGNWLNLDFFMFLVPIIWFYSFFDVLKKTSMEEPVPDDNIFSANWFSGQNNWFKEMNKIFGYILVGLGLVLILENIVLPMIDNWEYRRYIETGIAAALFIGGGVKLLMGSKNNTVDIKKDVM
jgi:hypothetical protein